jgi:hypothetical protein
MRWSESIGHYAGLFVALSVLILVFAWPGPSAAAEPTDVQDASRPVGARHGEPDSDTGAGHGRQGGPRSNALEERRRRILEATSMVLNLLDDAAAEGEEAASPWKPEHPPGKPPGRPPESPPGKGGEPPGKPDDRPPHR